METEKPSTAEECKAEMDKAQAWARLVGYTNVTSGPSPCGTKLPLLTLYFNKSSRRVNLPS